MDNTIEMQAPVTAREDSSKGFYKLSWLQRIGFGSGDLAQNLIYQTISMYLLFFYTNVYGLAPEVAAIMFLIVRIVDVIWDPLVGTFVDKHDPRWGKYRSYLLLGGIPLDRLRACSASGTDSPARCSMPTSHTWVCPCAIRWSMCLTAR